MIQDRVTSIEHYKRFLKNVQASGFVWALKSPEECFAQCPSNEFENVSVLVFWSDEAYAKRHIKAEWSNYKQEKIPLDKFINNWLKGMHESGNILIGPNWDAYLCGLELEPHMVAEDLIKSEN